MERPVMHIIPAVDILGGSAVRLVRGDYDAVTAFDADPVAAVRRWGSLGADPIHVVDLDAARGGDGARPAIEQCAAAGHRIQLGGGIRRVDDAQWARSVGVARVVLGSVLLVDPMEARRIVEAVDPAVIVAAVDVRGGAAMASGWLEPGVDLAAALRVVVDLGIPRALVTGIERDGTMEGPDIALLEQAKESAPTLELIASGGVGSLADIRTLATSGLVEAAIVGRALYEGAFTYPEAVAAGRS